MFLQSVIFCWPYVLDMSQVPGTLFFRVTFPIMITDDACCSVAILCLQFLICDMMFIAYVWQWRVPEKSTTTNTVPSGPHSDSLGRFSFPSDLFFYPFVVASWISTGERGSALRVFRFSRIRSNIWLRPAPPRGAANLWATPSAAGT